MEQEILLLSSIVATVLGPAVAEHAKSVSYFRDRPVTVNIATTVLGFVGAWLLSGASLMELREAVLYGLAASSGTSGMMNMVTSARHGRYVAADREVQEMLEVEARRERLEGAVEAQRRGTEGEAERRVDLGGFLHQGIDLGPRPSKRPRPEPEPEPGPPEAGDS